MPDLVTILAFYQAMAQSALSGALPEEAAAMSQPERDRVRRRFLSPGERQGLAEMPACDRQLKLRKGELRFRAWESANPDIAALLRRRAERQVFSGTACA